MNNFSMGAYLLVLLVLLVAFSLETHAQTCSKSDPPVSLTEPNPGECNTENNSECCKQDILYDTYTCSPPVSSATSATLTLNSFEEGGDGGAESQCDEQFHSNNELVVALSTGWYEQGARCNRWITINNGNNGQSVKAMVVDQCDSQAGCDKEHAYQPPCRYNVVDASKGVWEALGVSEENWGELEITWSDA
ncbi:putative ripening-related protein 1 [Tanacetum coccineum]